MIREYREYQNRFSDALCLMHNGVNRIRGEFNTTLLYDAVVHSHCTEEALVRKPRAQFVSLEPT